MPSSGRPKRILILGGTAEAAELAGRLSGQQGLEVITSLAGRTRSPGPLSGEVRVGGFGGTDGLARYLRDETIDLVVDATHPFAAVISENAARACDSTSRQRLVLSRPPWTATAGDQWIRAESIRDAADLVPRHGKRVFLTVGRQELAAFGGCSTTWFLIRTIDPPQPPPPLAQYEALLGRGPFRETEEVAVLQRYEIDLIVSKNSGSPSTYPKISAARRLGLPVLMVERPYETDLDVARVDSVSDAVNWITGFKNKT